MKKVVLIFSSLMWAARLYYSVSQNLDSKQQIEELRIEIIEQNEDIQTLSTQNEKLDIELKKNIEEMNNIQKTNDYVRQEVEQLKEKIQKLENELKEQKVSVSNAETFVLTAYTAGYESTQKKKGEVGYGITASGEPVKEGITIACPKEIPFGTRIDIEGLGIRVCEDVGGDIVGNRIDVYIEDLSEALAFGKQTRKIKILK